MFDAEYQACAVAVLGGLIKVQKSGNNKIFYGWVMVIVAFAIMTMGMGLLFSFGVFLKPLQEHFMENRASLSFISTINWFMLGFCSLLFGYLSDKSGIRKVVFTGGLIYGLGLLLSSQVTTVWQLYITFGVMAGVGTGSFFVPLNSAVAKWFHEKRGVAVAMVTAGTGIGVMIFSPLNRYLINTVGWRNAYLTMGLIFLATVLPLSMLLRDAPDESEPVIPKVTGGSPVDGETSKAKNRRTDKATAQFKTSAFWALTITHFACCLAHSGPLMHMVAFATDKGVPKMTAAAIFGIMGISNAVGRPVAGHIADRIGSKQTLTIFLALQAATMLSFLLIRQTWNFYLLAVLFGLAYGGVMPIYALIAREYYGPRIMGTVYGGVFLVASLGMGMGAYLGGYIFDTTGSYTWLFIIAAIAGSSAIYASSVLRPPRHLTLRPAEAE